MRALTVSRVEKGPPDALVGVEFGGADGYKVLSCAGLMYDPRVGDTVLVDYLGKQPFVVRCTTPGRTWLPSTVTLSIVNAAPSDPDVVPISSTYAAPNHIYAVRATPTKLPTTSGVLVARPVASGTWAPGGWRTDDSMPRQGSFGSGANKGCWFYPPGIFDVLAGQAGVTARMTVRRADVGGDPAGPIQLQVCHHGHVSQPTGEPTLLNHTTPAGADPARRSLVDFAVDAATVAAFVAGTAKGMAIASDVADQYLIALGPTNDADSGVITFTWSS